MGNFGFEPLRRLSLTRTSLRRRRRAFSRPIRIDSTNEEGGGGVISRTGPNRSAVVDGPMSRQSRRRDEVDGSIEPLVAEFTAVTGCDRALAEKRIRESKNNLTVALDAHFQIEDATSRRVDGGVDPLTKVATVPTAHKRARVEVDVDAAFAREVERAMSAERRYFKPDDEGFYRSIPLDEEAFAFTAQAFVQFATMVVGTRSEPWTDEQFGAGPASVDGRDGAQVKSDSSPLCRCGVKAKVKQVYKDGKNQGRLFFGCSKSGRGSDSAKTCDFFEWADGAKLEHTTTATTVEWKRFRPPRFRFAARGAKAADIRQGSVGDCWFLSALAVVAEREDLLQSLVGVNIDFMPIMERVGAYFVRFFLGGRWRAIVVDDTLPINPKKGAEFLPAFSRASNNQTWVSIVEKAYAKAHGSYAAISGGYVAEGLHDLSGAATEMIGFRTCGLDSEELWVKLVSFADVGFPLGCATSFSSEGIVGHHAYSILEIRELHGVQKGVQLKLADAFGSSSGRSAVEKESLRMIKLRNPWGKREWRGEFSSRSEAWTKQLGSVLSRTRADDGEFWMSYVDFLRHFSSVDVCRAPKGWNGMNLETSLKRNATSPAFHIRSDADDGGWVHVLLLQHTKRGRPRGHWYTDLSVMVWGRPVRSNDKWTPCGAIFGARKRESCQGDMILEKGKEYIVQIVSVAGGDGVPITLRLCSAKPLRAKSCPAIPNVAMNLHLAIRGESQITGGQTFKVRRENICGGELSMVESSGLVFAVVEAHASRKSTMYVDLTYTHEDDATTAASYQFQSPVTARPGHCRLAVISSSIGEHTKHHYNARYTVNDCSCNGSVDVGCHETVVGPRCGQSASAKGSRPPIVAPTRLERMFDEVDCSFWQHAGAKRGGHTKHGELTSRRVIEAIIIE